MYQKLRAILLIIVIVAGLTACVPPPTQKVMNRQIRLVGSPGTETGSFMEPRGITLTPSGDLLVTDFRNYRVQLLTRDGRFLGAWGHHGDDPGGLNDPTCAAMDSQGNLYVVDTWHHRIQKKEPSGAWLPDWATGDFYAPRGIAIDRKDRIFIANTSYHNVKVYHPDGRLIATWGNGLGSEPDQFHDPLGIACGPDGNIYVADTGNQRIKILDPDGRFIQQIRVPSLTKDKFLESYLAVDRDRKVYITIPDKHFVEVFSPEGNLYSRFGEHGGGPEQLSVPTGIAVDSDGFVYISDSLNNRVVKYSQPAAIVSPPKQAGALSHTLSILRIIVDIIAAVIVLSALTRWVRRRKKVAHAQAQREPTRWEKQLARLAAHRWLLGIAFGTACALLVLAIFLFKIDALGAGVTLMLAALVLLLFFELPRQYSAIRIFNGSRKMSRWEWAVLLIILVLALWVRVYKLGTIPNGINNDAAWNGMYALRILDGEPYTAFTAEAWGKSTIYFYFIALAFKLFGMGELQLILPSIFFSFITVVGFFFFIRFLHGTRFALFATALFSFLTWNIVFSRTGYRAVMSPLLLILTMHFFYRTVDSLRPLHRYLNAVLSGIFLGIGMHTYIAFRLTPILLIAVSAHEWFRNRNFPRKNWVALILIVIVSVGVFAPVGVWALNNWEMFTARSEFLFIGNKIQQSQSLTPLFRNIATNLLNFHYKARVGNFFNNDWPIITRILGFFMVLGLAVHLRHYRQRGPFLFTMLFFMGLMPSVLSEPDAARSILSTISVVIFAASGIVSLTLFIPTGRKKIRYQTTAMILLTGICCFAGYYNYFYRMADDYYAQFGYARKHTLIGRKGVELSRDYEIYISQGHFIDTPKFICFRVPGDVFAITGGEVIDVVDENRLAGNLEKILKSPRMEGKGLAFIFENLPQNAALLQKVQSMYPEGSLRQYRDAHYNNEIIYRTYLIEADQLHQHDDTMGMSGRVPVIP